MHLRSLNSTSDLVPPNKGIAASVNLTRSVAGLCVTGILYLVLILLASAGVVDRAAASVALILGIYLSLRPPSIVHPCTPVFLNYMLYLVMPYSLFWIYRVWNIEYVLPWGMINDWSAVSHQAIAHFEFGFVLFYVCIFVATKLVDRPEVPHSGLAAATRRYEVRRRGVTLLAVLMLGGVLFQFNYSGGVSAWLYNYSDTYINGKAGIGLLHYSLINLAHVLAFTAGWMAWRGNLRFPVWVWMLIVAVLLFCFILQGLKSSIAVGLFFFLMPKMVGFNIKIWKSALVFGTMVVFFMISMYFRSQGFYATPTMATEYLQSYFNTIFLHDLALSHFAPGEMNSMLMGAMKYTEVFVGKIPRESYDLSVGLTQQFYPKDWYEGGATQQWPVETDLYLTFPSPLFWILPISLYALLLAYAYRWSVKGSPVLMFVFAAEFVRMMSVFRSSLLAWDTYLQAFLYLFVYVLFAMLIFRRVGPLDQSLSLAEVDA